MNTLTAGRLGATLRRAAIALLVLTAALSVGATTAAGAASNSVSVSATIDGQPIANSSSSHPVQLHPGRITPVHLVVTNGTGTHVGIQSVDLTGKVVGLTFYSFNTSVDLNVAAHSTARLRFVLDTRALSGQAVGLIPGSLQVENANGDVVATQSMVTNVHGSLVSVYGLFGLALLLLTILAIVDVLLAMARHRMAQNRWRRGLRFMVPGIGIGLVLVFTMSALTLWTPVARTWLPVTAIFAIVFFVIGYLTPTPVLADEDEEDEEDDDEVPRLAASAAPSTSRMTASAEGVTFIPPPG